MLGTGNRKLNKTWLKPSNDSVEMTGERENVMYDDRDAHRGRRKRMMRGFLEEWTLESLSLFSPVLMST